MKKHEWVNDGKFFFGYTCTFCGTNDFPRKDAMDGHGISEEMKRIQSRTDCDIQFAKYVAAKRLLK
jgi:hypothetical protein